MIILGATIVQRHAHQLSSTDLSDQRPFPSIQWIVTGYALTFGGVAPARRQARRPARPEARIFIVWPACSSPSPRCSAALPTVSAFSIAARALAGRWRRHARAAALSLLTVTFEEGKGRDRRLRRVGRLFRPVAPPSASSSAASSPVSRLGVGCSTSTSPIALFAFWGMIRYVPESRDENAKGFDIIGALLITAGLALLVYGFAYVNDATVATRTKIGTIVGALVLIAALLPAGRHRTRNPLLPLRALQVPQPYRRQYRRPLRRRRALLLVPLPHILVPADQRL